MLPAITDTHCHLDFPDFQDDMDGVIARAHAAGVKRMVTISTEVGRVATYRALAERFDSVWFTVGTHPNHAHKEPHITLQDVLTAADHPKCVAIGEAGLDYHYDYATPKQQETSFRMQIEAARISGLPLVIHARAADQDIIAILEEEMAKGRFGAILHCYSSGPELARRGAALGIYLSLSGILTFKNSVEIREIAAEAPIEQLLVETDAPFLAPIPYRGKRNEPAYTAHTAAVLAEVRGMPLAQLAPMLEANTNRVFKKMAAFSASKAA